MDSISNHLPADSKGAKIDILMKQNDVYVPIHEADSSAETTEVIFQDDGSGYDAEMLSILFSSKGAGELSVGQFGEGLKLVASASLRNNVDLEYQSKNWTAKPFSTKEKFGEHLIERLCFNVDEVDELIVGSKTIIKNPSTELIDEVFRIPDKVLALHKGDYRVLNSFLANTAFSNCSSLDYKKGNFFGNYLQSPSTELTKYRSRIISFPDGQTSLFIKGVKISNLRSLFSYDLGLEDITPDRIFADNDEVLDSIEDLLKNYAKPEAIKHVLLEAQKTPYADYREFQCFCPRGQNLRDLFLESESESRYEGNERFQDAAKSNPWSIAFKELFGENAVLDSKNGIDNLDAKALGYMLIKLPSGISKYLHENGILYASNINSENTYRWVDPSNLTPFEKDLLNKTTHIDDIVLETPLAKPADVRVYEGLYTKAGRELESAMGVHIKEPSGEKYIGIKRAQLSKFGDFASTYIHELGHHVTGKGDYDREFTDFFVQALARLVEHQMINNTPS